MILKYCQLLQNRSQQKVSLYLRFLEVCAAIETKATRAMTTLRGAEQLPLAKGPVDRRHIVAEMAA